MDRSRFHRKLPEMTQLALPVGEVQVGLIGLGTLGSWSAQVLPRLGLRKFVLADPDVVGEENVATQAFLPAQVGRPKVEAVRDALVALLGDDCAVECVQDRVVRTWDGPPLDVLVVGTDSAASRRDIYCMWKQNAFGDDCWLLDHRMGWTNYECHVVCKGGAYEQEYGECLLSDKDEDYAALPCGATSIPFTGPHAAARITAVMADVLWKRKTSEGWFVERLDLSKLALRSYVRKGGV